MKKTQNQKWQILALALFVVLGFIGVPMAQQQGTEARAASMKWVENSDGLVLINVAHHSGLPPCSKQVRHCLREKGLPYESRYVELWRYENLAPDYLIN